MPQFRRTSNHTRPRAPSAAGPHGGRMVRMATLRGTAFFVSMAMIALGCSSGGGGAGEESTGTSSSEAADSIGDSIGIVRSYMPSTGEHFYTASYQEAVNAGFRIEAYPYYYLG